MKQDYSRVGIGPLCRLFGKTRHAYYDHLNRLKGQYLREDIVLAKVLKSGSVFPK